MINFDKIMGLVLILGLKLEYTIQVIQRFQVPLQRLSPTHTRKREAEILQGQRQSQKQNYQQQNEETS